MNARWSERGEFRAPAPAAPWHRRRAGAPRRDRPGAAARGPRHELVRRPFSLPWSVRRSLRLTRHRATARPHIDLHGHSRCDQRSTVHVGLLALSLSDRLFRSASGPCLCPASSAGTRLAVRAKTPTPARRDAEDVRARAETRPHLPLPIWWSANVPAEAERRSPERRFPCGCGRMLL